ncbi:unnamed protein product, partial [Mesorhabditis belari]|uniref:DM2 domain-containing protein n=1 Tax=Mesorhabditis belari TaxID=2138241 RepID=A0AAF3EXV3_9BILA
MMSTPSRPMPAVGGTPARFQPVTPVSQMRRNMPAAPMPAAVAPRPVAPPRKKKKYADKLIPPQVRELVPESQAYMDLLAFEQKLDSTITRKKLEIQEALKRPLKVKRRLRIYISHTFIAGKEPEKEGDEPVVPMWELRVEGRLLDDTPQAANGQATTPANVQQRQQAKRKFSSFFKSLVIELDKDIYGPDNHLVEWHRTPQTNETDGFQVKRPGDRAVKCTILLLLDHQPMKFKLHARLAKVLGIATETRPKIIEALWQYIKTHKLQDPIDRDSINNDIFLEQIFATKKMRFMEIPQRLHALLQQPDPLVLHHTIEQSEGSASTACYDIDVEVEDQLKQHMANFMQIQSNQHDIAQLDQKIYDIVDNINEWKLRRDYYVRFSDNPQEFIRKWLVSQSADLKNFTEQTGDGENERYAEAYYQPHIQEGTFRYIYTKVQQRRAELEHSLGVRNN